MPTIDQTAPELKPLTIFSNDIISYQLDSDYANWLYSYRTSLQAAPGFISFDCIETPQPTTTQYLRLIKFESNELYLNWLNTGDSAALMAQRNQLVVTEYPDQHTSGIAAQFTLAAAKPLPAPPFWKRALVTISCVYPLLMVLIWLLTPVFRGLPAPLAMLINVVIVGSLLTYPILPFVFRVLAPWLNGPTKLPPKKVS